MRGGHNDTRGTTLVVGSGGSGGQAPSNPTLPNTIGQVGSAVQMSGVSAGNPTPQYQWWTALGVPIAGAITMIVPLIVVPIVSLMTAPPAKELVDKAFGTGARSRKFIPNSTKGSPGIPISAISSLIKRAITGQGIGETNDRR